MTTQAGGPSDRNTEIRRPQFRIRNEIAVIPGWALGVAVAIFVLIPVLLLGVIFPRQSPANLPPVPFRILLSLLLPTVFAFLTLMIGYVNRDAGRRGMSRTLWTLLVIFIPNAIGFILYFLLRAPVRLNCPKCGAVVEARANYCPQCRYSFHPTCPQCKAAVQPGDAFCMNCGLELDGR